MNCGNDVGPDFVDWGRERSGAALIQTRERPPISKLKKMVAPTSGALGTGVRSGPCSLWGSRAAPILLLPPFQQHDYLAMLRRKECSAATASVMSVFIAGELECPKYAYACASFSASWPCDCPSLFQLSTEYSRLRNQTRRSLDPSKSSIRHHSDRSVSSLRLLVLLFKEPLERIGRLSGLA